MKKDKIHSYVNRFAEIYDGTPWFGDSISAKLEGLTHKEAFVIPAKATHSIAQLVAHMIYWRSALIRRLTGEATPDASVDHPDNWKTNEELKRAGWPTLLENFRASQDAVIRLLQKENDDLLKRSYRDGHTFEYLIQGVIDHDLYHLGQIGLIKAMTPSV